MLSACGSINGYYNNLLFTKWTLHARYFKPNMLFLVCSDQMEMATRCNHGRPKWAKNKPWRIRGTFKRILKCQYFSLWRNNKWVKIDNGPINQCHVGTLTPFFSQNALTCLTNRWKSLVYLLFDGSCFEVVVCKGQSTSASPPTHLPAVWQAT